MKNNQNPKPLTDEQIFNVCNAIRPYIPGQYKASVLLVAGQEHIIVLN